MQCRLRKGCFRFDQPVHDTGAAANILRFDAATTWTERGDGVVYMGGFTGGQDKLTGGNDLRVFLRVDDTVNNTVESDAKACGKLTMESVLAEVALEEGTGPSVGAHDGVAQVDEHSFPDAALEDDDNDLLVDVGSELGEGVLGRLKSAKSVVMALGEQGKRYRFNQHDEPDEYGTKLTQGLSL